MALGGCLLMRVGELVLEQHRVQPYTLAEALHKQSGLTLLLALHFLVPVVTLLK